MKKLPYLGLILGLIVMAALILWQGFAQVFELLGQSGLSLFWLPIAWSPCLIPATLSWRELFVETERLPFRKLLRALWIGRAVNTLLPVASIGGEVLKARLVYLWGVSGTTASASVVVDKTVQAFAMVIWGTIGVILLLGLVGEAELATWSILGFVVLSLGIMGFLFVQKAGLFGLVMKPIRWIAGDSHTEFLSSKAGSIDRAVNAIYARPRAVVRAVALRFFGLVWQTSEVWLAAYLLGLPINLLEAMMLKSMSGTLSDVAFIIPNAYGIQEGAYIALGALLGLPADSMLALSLATRLRELCIDLPGLLAWQLAETKTASSQQTDLDTCRLLLITSK